MNHLQPFNLMKSFCFLQEPATFYNNLCPPNRISNQKQKVCQNFCLRYRDTLFSIIFISTQKTFPHCRGSLSVFDIQLFATSCIARAANKQKIIFQGFMCSPSSCHFQPQMPLSLYSYLFSTLLQNITINSCKCTWLIECPVLSTQW